MSNILITYIKYCFLTAAFLIGFFCIFLPLDVWVPEFPIQFVPSFYQQFSIWYIVTDLHYKFTLMVMILATIFMAFVTIWKEW